MFVYHIRVALSKRSTEEENGENGRKIARKRRKERKKNPVYDLHFLFDVFRSNFTAY